MLYKSKVSWLVALLVAFSLALAACGPSEKPGAPGDEGPPPKGVPEDDPRAMAGNKWLTSLSDEELRQVKNEDLEKWFPVDLGCPAKQVKRGGTYNFGTNWDPPHYDPTFTESGGLMQLSTVNYDTLLEFVTGCKYDPLKLQIEPGLAESWSMSSDGLVYTFKIRKGIKWVNKPPVNGRELTAEDVRWSIEHYMTEKGALQKADYETVDRVEVVDPYTLKITLKTPTFYLLTRLASRKHLILPREIKEADGDFKTRMVGSGPFILEELKPKQYAYLKRNPNYWDMGEDGKPKPYIDDYYIYFMPDEATQQAAFRSGELDVIQATPSGLKGYQAFIKSKPDVSVMASLPTAVDAQAILMRTDKPELPFKDVRVRRAMSMAIDRQQIIDAVYEGTGTCTMGVYWYWVWDKLPGCNELGPYFQYNPQEAKKLLSEAGYPNGFSFTVTFYRYSSQIAQRLEVAKEDLKKVGIDMKIREEDYAVYNNKLATGTYDEVTHGWQAQGFDHDIFFYTRKHSKSPGNRAHYNDPELDRLLDATRAELDDNKRTGLFRKIIEREQDQVHAIWVATTGGGLTCMRASYVRNLRQNSPGPSCQPAYGGVLAKDTWLDKK